MTPEGIDERPGAVAANPELERVRRLSHLLDDSIRVPGTDVRFGIDPVLSILPIKGDLVAMALSLYVVWLASKAGVPGYAIAGMLAHVFANFVVSVVPVVGQIIDARWKVNKRNLAVMESHVDEEGVPAA